MNHKKPNLRFYSSNTARANNIDRVKKLFRIKSLNVKVSRYQKQSPESVTAKKISLKILWNSLKNICDAVLN